MKKKRFTEAQIAFALRQAESGISVSEIIRKMGISEVTFYRWKKKYGGLGVSELRKLKQLGDHTKTGANMLSPFLDTIVGMYLVNHGSKSEF